jgi:hypothetical protein
MAPAQTSAGFHVSGRKAAKARDGQVIIDSAESRHSHSFENRINGEIFLELLLAKGQQRT